MCNPRISNLVPFVALALSKQRKYRIALTKKRTGRPDWSLVCHLKAVIGPARPRSCTRGASSAYTVMGDAQIAGLWKKGWIRFLDICKARTNTVDGAKAPKSET